MKKIHALYYDKENTTLNELWNLKVMLSNYEDENNTWIFIPKDHNYEYFGDYGKECIIKKLEQLIKEVKESD